jgi:hypothetical protein
LEQDEAIAVDHIIADFFKILGHFWERKEILTVCQWNIHSC